MLCFVAFVSRDSAGPKCIEPGSIAQLGAYLTQKPEVPGSSRVRYPVWPHALVYSPHSADSRTAFLVTCGSAG